MTREEAIKILNEEKDFQNTLADKSVFNAISIAVEALRQQPCEDCISRAEAINALDEHKYSNEFCEEHNIDWSVNLGMVHILLNELPSVTPTRPTGYWIFTTEGNTDHITCSVCDRDSMSNFDYCPNCGAKMIESEE